MSTYARIDGGIVVELIESMLDEQGNEIPLSERFAAEFVSTLHDVTGISPQPAYMWRFDGVSFSPPAPWTRPA